MVANTFKWLGGQGGVADPNDYSVVANWLVEQGGSFVAAGSLPAAGDTMLLDSGTIDDTGVNFVGNTLDLLGNGVQLMATGMTFDADTTISAGAGVATSILVGAGVTNDGTMTVGSGGSLFLKLAGDLTNDGLITAGGGTLDVATTGNSGVLFNDGMIEAPAGSAIVAQGVENFGTIAAVGGSVSIDSAGGLVVATEGGTVSDVELFFGTIVVQGAIASVGTAGLGAVLGVGSGTLSVGPVPDTDPRMVFVDDTGTLVLVPYPEMPSGPIFGFGATAAIDLPNVAFATLGTIAVNGNTVTVGSATLDIVGTGLGAAGFSAAPDPTGGTVLTGPGAQAELWSTAVDGDWSDAAKWSGNAAPTASDQALIVNFGTTAFTVTATDAAARSVLLQAGAGTLTLAGLFSVADGIVDGAGVVDVAAGATLTSTDFTATSPTSTPIGTLILGDGAVVSLSGSLQLAGSLAVAGGSFVRVGTSLETGATETLSVDRMSSVVIGDGARPGPGTLLVSTGDTWTPTGGVIVPTLDLAGDIVTYQGLVVTDAWTGTGVIAIGSGDNFVTGFLDVQTEQPFHNEIDLFGALTIDHDGSYQGTVELKGSPHERGALFGNATFDLRDVAFADAEPVWNPSVGIASLGTLVSFSVAPVTVHGAWSIAPDKGGGTVVTFVCYAAGTRIATPGGEAAVEALRAGDLVLVQDADSWTPRPVRWVGWTTVDLERHPAPDRVAPIVITANAFAPGVPHRDLRVSPDHAVVADGVLMQAQSLVNGATILRAAPVGRVTYVHVELDRHSILLAEGLPAESYLDTGNRGWFDAETGVRPLFPDFAQPRSWAADGCLKLLLTGSEVASAHARLLRRAHVLGHRIVTDPALRVLVDEVPVQSLQMQSGRRVVTLPIGARTVRLLSRSFVPDDFDPAANDRRRLGVAVAGLRLGPGRLAADSFGAGWHASEPEWRWTDGDATLSFPPLVAKTTLAFGIVPAGPGYWVAPEISDRGGHRLPSTSPTECRADGTMDGVAWMAGSSPAKTRKNIARQA